MVFFKAVCSSSTLMTLHCCSCMFTMLVCTCLIHSALSLKSFSSLHIVSQNLSISFIAGVSLTVIFFFSYLSLEFLSIIFKLSCLDLPVTLEHSIPQNLHFFIFNTFWTMFISFSLLFRFYFPHSFQ